MTIHSSSLTGLSGSSAEGTRQGGHIARGAGERPGRCDFRGRHGACRLRILGDEPMQCWLLHKEAKLAGLVMFIPGNRENGVATVVAAELIDQLPADRF